MTVRRKATRPRAESPRFDRAPSFDRLRQASPALYGALDSAVREGWEHFTHETKRKVLMALALADGKSTVTDHG
jgi:hypothetical protein